MATPLDTKSPRPWDYFSGVSECEACEGTGSFCKPPRGMLYPNPLEWQVGCDDCAETGVFNCPVCGFDEVVEGYDCLVCATVNDLSTANMKRINPADLAESIARAIAARLDHERKAA